MRCVSRIAVFLCLLVMMNEFGPAHFLRIELPVNSLSKRSDNIYPDEEDVVKEQDEEDTLEAEERGLGKIGTKIFKVVDFGSQFLPKVATLAGTITTIYSLITQCCHGKWKNTCIWTDEVEAIRRQLEIDGREAEKIQLNIKNIQAALISGKNYFDDVVRKMNDIGLASGDLLTNLDPKMESALNKTSNKLESLLREKAALGEKVKFVKLETQFFGVMDGILGIAVPMFTTVIPSVPKLIKWAKARMGRYKSYELDHSVDAKAIEPPDKNDAKYQSSQSWFGKQKSKLAFQIDSADYKLKTKYKKAYDVFSKVKKYLGIVTGYAGAAYTIYSITKKFEKCNTAYEEAEKAVKEMRKAKDQMALIMNATLQAQEQMVDARDQLQANVTGDIFIKDLQELKNNLALIKGDGIDQNFLGVLKGIGNYIQEAPKVKDATFLEVSELLGKLYVDLSQLPEYYSCYTDKVVVVRNVVKKCREGVNKLEVLTEDARDLTDNDWEKCQKMIGMPPVTADQMEEVIEKESAKKNFSKICELNSEARNKTVCNEKCKGGKKNSNTQLARDMNLSIKVIDIMLASCKLSNCETARENICDARDYGASNASIHKRLYPHFKLEEVQKVECPENTEDTENTEDAENMEDKGKQADEEVVYAEKDAEDEGNDES